MRQSDKRRLSLVSFITTIEATHPPDGSVKLVHCGAAGLLVVTINILSYDNQVSFLLESHQGMVSGIGLRLSDQLPTPVIPIPDQFGIGMKGSCGGQLFRAVLAPERIFTTAKSGDATGG